MVATNTTTTTVTSTANRVGVGITVDSQSNTVTVGNFVTDVSLQPFITNRVISVFAYNMRPSRRLHVFFDSINVDQYCAPGVRTSNTYPTPVGDASDYTIVTRGGNWGTAIYSDVNGRVAFQFNIPAGKFKTGDRSIQIADVDSLVYGNDAITTVSSAVFTASNLSVSKQNVTLTTVNADLNFIPISNTVVTSTTSVKTTTIGDNITVLPPPPPPPFPWWLMEPIAQSLTINTPQGEAGIYATSLDIYFKQKSLVRENGVMIYLCETKNGYPDGSTILPFSKVHLTYDEVSVSEDGTVPTTFTFSSPVFLNNKLTYAFVVKPDGNDQDYQVYTAFLGDTDLSTGYQVFSQPVLGTAFYGATDLQWTALQKEYIKFSLKRAQFNKNAGEAYFFNSNTDYITMLNLSYVNTSVGILSGDYVYRSTNATTNSTGGSVNTSVYAVVDFYDSVKGIIYTDKSTGNFISNTYVQIHRFANGSVTTPNNTTYIASGNTGLLYNPVIDALVPQLAAISPAGTALNHTFVGTSNVYTIDADERKINLGYENEFFDQERIVASKSNEMTNMSSNKSFQMKSYLRTDSDFLSPAIDTVRYQQLVIKNDVDPVMFNYNEYFNSGNTKSKYISQIITLAPGQDAEDLQIILTAFRPVNSDIEVWVKFLNGEDTDQISQKTWTPLYNASYDVYSDPSNPNDYREFVFKVGSFYGSYLANGTITCTTGSTTITGSNTFFSRDLKPGWFINLNADNAKKIVSIASNTSLTVESAFANNHTAEAFYLVPPYTTPWLSNSTKIQLSGTVSTYTTNNTIIGSGTTFSTLKAGNIIEVNGDLQTVLYVANNTSLAVGTPWSANNTGANAFVVSPSGVTYYNNNLNLYSSFKQFQIKIILKSNDSSKVPFIDDLRALALQL